MSRNTALKEENIQLIRQCFYRGGIWTKTKLSKETGISLAATTNILMSLLDNWEILLTGKAASTGGRKSKQYTLNPDYFHIGKIIFRNRGDHYQLIAESVRADDKRIHQQQLDYTHNVHDFITITETLLKEDYLIKILTISIPGIAINGYISLCDFKEFEGTDLGAMIRDYFHMDYIIENDVNTAAIGYSEQYHIKNMLLLYQPKHEFIGTGIIIDGRLYYGFHHRAGEVRFLPGHSEEELKQKTADNPEKVLKETILTLMAILDPEKIVYLSDYEIDDLKLNNINLTTIKTIDNYIRSGLYQIGKKALLNKEAN